MLLGLLAFAGSTAINAIFSLGIIGQYTAFTIPVASRLLGGELWIPGPFSLGKIVSSFASLAKLESYATLHHPLIEYPRRHCHDPLAHLLDGDRHVSFNTRTYGDGNELYCSCRRWMAVTMCRLLREARTILLTF